MTDEQHDKLLSVLGSILYLTAIWIQRPYKPRMKRNGKNDTPHLIVEDAKKVRDALNEFISAYE
ncbi:hypothetical protein O0550_00255 [Brevibacillus halotolerans]|uniref:hypothetical protein n=1 Tax=Brevibacillus TaxID=55080 RepID=UPI00215CD44B|nr:MULTISPECIES: hypothetical protein [Brevibacillus]MCR8961641.1 hypothetical protein [Brevibacillus laterosporus]MCZ0833796.1 hypothetical protein [Brevibacillus halotolerans]